MQRRQFLTLLGGAAADWPLAARAQRPKLPVIGFLTFPIGEVSDFLSGLKEVGYIEGRNISLLFGPPGPPKPPPLAARELVAAQVAVIVVVGSYDWLLAAKDATSTIPIVYAGGVDPVTYGFAASLNRPGGNITGMTLIYGAFADKQLDLLLKLVPEATSVGYLTGAFAEEVDQLSASARSLGRRLIVLQCHSVDDISRSFDTIAQERVGALIVGAFPIGLNNRETILTLVADRRIPTIYTQSIYVREGGLMSYSPANVFRQLAVQYVARILKGAKPMDLPIQQPIYFEFIINHRAARTLGLTFPATLELLADEAID